MNYPLKNSPPGSGLRANSRDDRNRYKKPVQITAVIIVLLIVVRLLFPKALDSFFTGIFSPLWRMEDAATADDFFSTHAGLVSQNARLEDELDALAPAEASIALLEQENAELKAMLGRSAPGENLVLAAVLKTAPLSAYDSLILDIGSDEKIEAGDRVFAMASPPDLAGDNADSGIASNSMANGTETAVSSPEASSSAVSSASLAASSTGEVLAPIGTVSEVSAAAAQVDLFSSPGTRYSVVIGPDHIPATAVARGGGMFAAELAQGSDVAVGDPITVPDIQTIVFGTVGSIENDPAHPYMDVLFREPVNIYELRWVLVEKDQE